MRPIVPRKIFKGGKWVYQVYVPKFLVGGRVGVREQYQTEKAAKARCAMLEGVRSDLRSGVEVLPLDERMALYGAFKAAGSVERVRKAVEFYEQHNPTEFKTIVELVQDLCDDRKRSGYSISYLKSLRSTLNQFSLTFGQRQAHTLKASEISEWLHNQEWSAESKKGVLKNIRTLYSFAVKNRLVTFNPADDVEKPKVSRKPPGILTVEEAERFMRTIEAHDPGLIPNVALLLFGGLRPEESRRCRWEYVSTDHIDLPATEAKLNSRRLIELNSLPTLRAWLLKGGDMPPTNLRKRMDKVRELAKVPWCNDILRHSFVSYSVPINGITQTSLLAGHSEAILKSNYLALVKKVEAEAFWRILPK